MFLQNKDVKVHRSFGGWMMLIFAAFALLVCVYSCHDDPVATGPDVPLRFSTDTLRFDTVFTTAGSATRSFKIYNDQSEAIIIDEITIGNPGSFFRINADGVPGPSARDVRIDPMDSIYVFAEVTIDPDQPLSISPFIIEEQIEIHAASSSYEVFLEAWGQNANYLPGREAKGQLNYISCDLGQWRWDDPRPYVIYGALIIDSCNVVIPEGQQVYVHGGIAINELGVYNDGILIFLSHGRLTANGSASRPVRFASDRLEEEFRDVPGQWGGIIFNAGSKNNLLRHTRIENAIAGITVDSSSFLRMEQCKVAFTSGNGISAAHGSIYAQNCLFYQNNGHNINLRYGGSYIFNYCTFVNTDNQQPALQLSNFRCTDALCQGPILINPLYAAFSNCIIVGNNDDEISLNDATEGSNPNSFAYAFDHSIVMVDDLLDQDAYPDFLSDCEGCYNVNQLDSLFIDPDAFDFHLDTLSMAIDKAIPIPPINIDLDGNGRESNTPDIGCYEFIK